MYWFDESEYNKLDNYYRNKFKECQKKVHDDNISKEKKTSYFSLILLIYFIKIIVFIIYSIIYYYINGSLCKIDLLIDVFALFLIVPIIEAAIIYYQIISPNLYRRKLTLRDFINIHSEDIEIFFSINLNTIIYSIVSYLFFCKRGVVLQYLDNIRQRFNAFLDNIR